MASKAGGSSAGASSGGVSNGRRPATATPTASNGRSKTPRSTSPATTPRASVTGGASTAAASGPRKPSASPSAASGRSRRSYGKAYSFVDESIAGESMVSLGSIDENGECRIPEELIRSIGMDGYTMEEKEQLDNLLQRLQTAKRQDERRREKLRRELDRMMKQVSRVQNRGEQPGLLFSLCDLCGARLYVVHRRHVCNRCAYLACQNCVFLVRGSQPQCRLCRLELLNQVTTGDWLLAETQRRNQGQVFFGPDILHASLYKERLRMIEEARQRRAQEQARQQELERQQQQLEAEQQRSGKKGKKDKDHKSRDKRAEGSPTHQQSGLASEAVNSAGSRRSSQQQQQSSQPPVSISVQSPDHADQEIHPEDSISLVGERRRGLLDLPDGDILIQQAAQHPGYQQPQSQPRSSAAPSLHRGSNLLAVDATSRESMASNVSETEASYAHGLTPSGEVEVNLQYNYKERRFTVNVVQCRNLPHLEGNPPNPYVKTYLLPDKTKRSKRRTQTKRGTANPIYSEQLAYNIVKSELETRTLQVSVWHSLTFGSNVFLGEARIPLESYRFDGGYESLSLERRIEVPVPLPTLMYRGDIMLALRYLSGELIKANQLAKDDPTKKDAKAGRLEVWVQNCRNLAGSGSSASPYVKGYLLNPAISGKSQKRDPRTKQKSAIVKGDLNPNFNSILAFDNVSLNELRSRSLELTVWDHAKVGKNDFLGGLRLNVGDGHLPWMDARGHESLMWSRMLEKPNAWVEGSLLLRPNMDQQEIQKPHPEPTE